MSYHESTTTQGFSSGPQMMPDRQQGYDSGSQSSLFYDHNVRNSMSAQPMSSQGINHHTNHAVFPTGPYGPHVTTHYQPHHSQLPFQQAVPGMVHNHDSNAQGRIAQQQYMMPMQGAYQLHQMAPLQN